MPDGQLFAIESDARAIHGAPTGEHNGHALTRDARTQGPQVRGAAARVSTETN
jgi:hypothetical protein